MTSTFDIKGLDKTIKRLEDLRKNGPRAAAAALYAEGLAIEAASVRLVPVDTGRMRATHYCSPPEEGTSGPEVHVGYGTDYALAVHERMHVFHEVGEAKFLEIPFKDAVAGFTQRMADRIRGYIESGRGMGVLSSGASTQTREQANVAGTERHAKTMSKRTTASLKRKTARIKRWLSAHRK